MVCSIRDPVTRSRLLKKPRDMVFFRRDILLPERVRCCRDHLYMRELSSKALQKIEGSHAGELFVDADGIQRLLEDFRTCLGSSRTFDFDNPSAIDDEAYVTITGLHKSETSFLFYCCNLYFLDDFGNMVDGTSSMRNSRTRSVRVSLVVFLYKMRHGLSNRLLATLFFLRSKRSVSWIIHKIQ